VRLPREQQHDHKNPSSHKRKLHRSKSDATRDRLLHTAPHLAG
jgi:hypothetical protein